MTLAYKLVFLFLATPAFAVSILPNGAPLFHQSAVMMPTHAVSLSFHAGSGSLPPEQQGLLAILSEMLQEGPATTTPENYREALFLQSASISFSSDAHSFSIDARSPSAALKETLVLVGELLSHPRFDEETFQIAKRKVLTNRIAMNEDMRSVLFYFAPRDFYGYQPVVLEGDGSPWSIEHITLADVEQFAADNLQPRQSFAASVGPLAEREVLSLLSSTIYAKAPASAYAPRGLPALRHHKTSESGSQVVLVDKPGATDNQILILLRNAQAGEIPLGTKQSLALRVALHLLGGSSSSEFFRILRAERGLTYHASSGLMRVGNAGLLYLYSFAGTKQTPELLTGLAEIYRNFHSRPIDAARFAEAKDVIASERKQRMELPTSALDEELEHYASGLDHEFYRHYLENLEGLTPADSQAAMQQYFTEDRGMLYLMGDKSALIPQLVNLGYAEQDIRVVGLEEIK